jgi:hypothetical protein
MTKPKTSTEKPTPVEELIARHQLKTEKQIEDLGIELRSAIGIMKTHMGELADWRQLIEERAKAQEAAIKEHAFRMDQGLREANVLIRVAVEQTGEAKETLAAAERAKEMAPDLSEAVGNNARKLGEVQDNLRLMAESIQALGVKLDEAISGDVYEQEESETSEGASIAQAILGREAQAASR